MSERVMQFWVGVMVTATFLATGILIVLFAEPQRLVQGSYPIQIVFEQAPGVQPETPVRKSGMRIGRVTKVEFAKDRDGRQDTRVLVTAAIDDDKRIYQDETVKLQSNLLGDAVLEFIRTPARAKSVEPIAPGQIIKGESQMALPELADNLQGDLKTTIVSVSQTANELREVARALTMTLQNVNIILEENRGGLKGSVDQARMTLVAISRAADGVNQIVGDAESQRILKEQIRRMPQIMEDVQLTVRGMKQTFSTLDRSMVNVEKFTGALGNDQFVARIDSSVRSLDATLQQLNAFMASVNNPNGSIGKLVNDPELYQHLNRAAQNVEQLTAELEPIIRDARVLTDKAARHPGVFLKDAVKPGPGIK